MKGFCILAYCFLPLAHSFIRRLHGRFGRVAEAGVVQAFEKYVQLVSRHLVRCKLLPGKSTHLDVCLKLCQRIIDQQTDLRILLAELGRDLQSRPCVRSRCKAQGAGAKRRGPV